MRYKPFRWLGAAGLTALGIWLLLRTSDLDKLLIPFQSVKPGYLLLAFALGLTVNLLRASRLASLLERRLDLPLIKISLYHNLIANVTPLRLGEVALPLLLRRAQIERASTAFGLLVIIRGVELMVVMALSGGAGALLTSVPPQFSALRWISGGLALSAVVLLIVGPRMIEIVTRFVENHPFIRGSRFSSPILGFAAAFRTLGNRRYIRIIRQTVAINFLLFTSYWVCANAFHDGQTVVGLIFAGAAGSFAFALPINGLAGYGPFEAAWVFALKLDGVSMENALVSGFVAHTLMTLSLTMMTAIALLIPTRQQPQQPLP